MKTRWWIALASAALAVGLCRGDKAPPPLRIATFNIEDFPKDRRQVDGAFTEIAGLSAGIVAVQEITEPELFARVAHERLGARWQFAYTHTDRAARHPVHHLGVLYDGAAYALVSTAVHDDTRLEDGRNKPTFEVRLRPASGAIVRVLVVHLKAGGDGADIRARQLAALQGLVRAAGRSGDRVVLLGDFNATGEADRERIAILAGATGLSWASEPLACSAFWNRDDGCPRSRLDHVLSWAAPATIEAAGACAREGCDWQDRCPVDAEQVSDHCPVVATFE